MFVTDVHALGAETAQGLQLTEAFYWDQNDATREWSDRFEAIHGAKPTMVHAGVYSGTMAYLAAVEAEAGSTDGMAVADNDEGDGVRRSALRQGHGARRRPGDPRHVSIRGQGSGRIRPANGTSTTRGPSIRGDEAFLPMLEECDFTKPDAN